MSEPSRPPFSDETPAARPTDSNATGAFVSAAGDTGAIPSRETPLPIPAIPDLPPGYEFLRELGRGGMGVVYQARDRKLNRLIALKMILVGSHASPGELQRFLIEAEAVAALQHPNIVQIFETGWHQGLPYFTLEFVSGGALAGNVREHPLPPRDAACLVEQLAHGVAYAHGKGIVHRDLKPENVLLAARGVADAATLQAAEWVPKITDFGLAKRVGEPGASAIGETVPALTSTGAVMGTPSYMAPEQATGQKDIGPSADVYALGAILYRLLTGQPPFQAATILETLKLVQNEEPVPASRLSLAVPRDLEAVVHKCLEKKPARRYASAQALADDLRRFLDGEPVLARPVGWLDRKLKWTRRHPLAAAVYGMAALVVLLVLIGGSFAKLWHDANEARKKADDEHAEELERLKPPLLEFSREEIEQSQRERAKKLGLKVVETVDLGAGVKMEFVLVPPGKFWMGAKDNELGDPNVTGDAIPRHEVEITQPMYVGKYAVTRGQFRRFAESAHFPDETDKKDGGYGWKEEIRKFDGPKPEYSWMNAGFLQTDEHPVVNVSWNDARRFCAWLQAHEANRLRTLASEGDVVSEFSKVRLPREAEWEYSCRAGTTTRHYFSDDPEDLAKIGNVYDASGGAKLKMSWEAIRADDGYAFTAPVGSFQPNSFGLYDMIGNVSQWCEDGRRRYSNQSQTDPEGPGTGATRALRGGSYNGVEPFCRSSTRRDIETKSRYSYVGFRVVLVR